MSFRTNVDNFLETQIRELDSRGIVSMEYEDLYKGIGNERLKNVFSRLHAGYIDLFRTLNERLPTGVEGAHFWADPSRELIFIIELTMSLQGVLKKTAWAFSIDEYYDGLIRKCRDFLSNSGGSTIPPHMSKITLCYLEPIFNLTETAIVNSAESSRAVHLKQIGEGSYANVLKYRDEFYKKDFIVKRAKSGLSEKELQRFKREFEEMQSLCSPYIVEVYSYNDAKHQYVMEALDFTLEKYISSNNSKMTLHTRKSIIMQLLRAYRYLHSKNIFHRDVSIKMFY